MMLITHEQAKKLKVPGWDVFQKSHLMYMEGINRQAAVAELNLEAFKAFYDTILIAKSGEIIRESQQLEDFIASGKRLGVDDFHWPNTQIEFGKFRNYEYLKIGCGFELSLKAKLLKHGVVIHEIDRTDPRYTQLAKDQRNRPIVCDELFLKSGYMHNGTINILPGVSKKSLSFSTILDNEHYRQSIGLATDTLEVIGEYRELRNMIHLPGDPNETVKLRNMSWQEKINFLRKYIDEHIVKVNREIVADWGLHKAFTIEQW